MNSRKAFNQKRVRRGSRARAKIHGLADKPRLSVFRSNRFLYAQLISDREGRTLASFSSKELTAIDRKKTKINQAGLIGEMIAKKALSAGINQAVFDRSFYKYHGRVKALAEGARKGGLKI